MVIGRSDEQQSPSDSMAFTTPRECLALLGGTHLGQRPCTAQTGRTHDRNRTENRNFPSERSCTNGAVHTRVRAPFGCRLIVKSLYLLSYIDDGAYRRRILVQLNRGEGRYQLARAVFHGKRGELRQRYRERQENQLGALGLVVNVIVL